MDSENASIVFDSRCDTSEIDAILRGLSKEFKNAAKRRLRVFGNVLKAELANELPVRSGTLQRRGIKAPSVDIDTREGRENVTVKFKPNLKAVPYANIIERGGAIRPTNGQTGLLAVPLSGSDAALRGFKAKDLKENPEALGYDSSFIRHDIIYGKRGAVVVPNFVLKTEVIHQRAKAGHHYARFQARQVDRFRSEVLSCVVEAIETAKAGTHGE